MRVLHVASSLDARVGGPVTALLGLVRAQRAAGLDVSVVATWMRGEDLHPADQLMAEGVPVTMVGPCLHRLVRWRPGLRRAIDNAVARADAVHIHALWEEIQARAAASAIRHGKPFWIRPCGMLDPWSLGQRGGFKRIVLDRRLRPLIDRATGIHYTADEERDLAAPLGLRAPAVVEPNGVEWGPFETLPERGTFRRARGLPAGAPVVLFLGRLHYKKGLDLLVPAFAHLKTRDARLVLAGPGEAGYESTVRSMVHDNGIAPRTLMAGMLRGPDKVAALVDADVLVLPSRQENFGIVVVEALAAGLPVVISENVNLRSVIEEHRVGAAVPLKAPAIAKALDAALRRTPDQRHEIAERARHLAREEFDWLRIGARWANRYRVATRAATKKT